MMKLPVTLERDESGMIVAECPAIPGCVSQGRTEEEAIANIKDAIVASLEARAEQGVPLTVRTLEVDVAVDAANPCGAKARAELDRHPGRS